MQYNNKSAIPIFHTQFHFGHFTVLVFSIPRLLYVYLTVITEVWNYLIRLQSYNTMAEVITSDYILVFFVSNSCKSFYCGSVKIHSCLGR